MDSVFTYQVCAILASQESASDIDEIGIGLDRHLRDPQRIELLMAFDIILIVKPLENSVFVETIATDVVEIP